MKIRQLHRWDVSPSEAILIQNNLARQVSFINGIGKPCLIAGADISAGRVLEKATAAVVVLRLPGFEIVDSSVINCNTAFPYIPGLLSFRESPLVIDACRNLKTEFDLLLVDGQGVAHPRRFGLASHLGLLLDKPTIGCAKSRLIGTYQEPADQAGKWTELIDDDEVIGSVLRTRQGVKPLYVSIGHRIDLASAVRWTLASCGKYRIPEPLRLAHIAAGNVRISEPAQKLD